MFNVGQAPAQQEVNLAHQVMPKQGNDQPPHPADSGQAQRKEVDLLHTVLPQQDMDQPPHPTVMIRNAEGDSAAVGANSQEELAPAYEESSDEEVVIGEKRRHLLARVSQQQQQLPEKQSQRQI